MTPSEEEPVVFPCAGDRLIGVLHRPRNPHATGVVVVSGGPQYRVGSHRQSVLLGRHLARAGFPVLRFDYRGIGDSEGEFAGFEAVDDDIRSAVDCLVDNIDGLKRLALWGLCDGASAAAFYANRDTRIAGLVLVNPWVRTEATVAQAYIKNYYGGRLASSDFWRRLARLEVDLGGAARDIWRGLKGLSGLSGATETAEDLPGRVAHSLRRYEGRVLLILSAADLTAQEFDTVIVKSSTMRAWRRDPRVTLRRLEGANHTYSRVLWRDQLHDWTVAWLRQFS